MCTCVCGVCIYIYTCTCLSDLSPLVHVDTAWGGMMINHGNCIPSSITAFFPPPDLGSTREAEPVRDMH